jgi:DNA recombination protein RmuC
MEYTLFFFALINGALILYLMRNAKNAKSAESNGSDLPAWAEAQLAEQKANIESLQAELKSQNALMQQARLDHAAEISAMERELAIKAEKLDSEQSKFQELKANEDATKEAMKNEFKVLAEKILEDKSKTFKTTNSEELEKLLSPFKTQLDKFEKRINETHTQEIKQAGELMANIKALQEMNNKLTAEASGLAKALRGDTKKQGNWGEFVLERALEMSGLLRDQEYFIQNSKTLEDGKRLQPDVVIQLPGDKKIIVDSKVSLVAWDAFVNAENEEEAERQLKNHALSIRTHVKGLSEKDYTRLHEGMTPEFVLLFIPIEPAFMEVTKYDPALYEFAFERRIIIVSNSTLLATLKTIAMSWRQEKQTKHVIEIADAGGKLYDKFQGLTEDLLTLGKQFGTAQKTYTETMKKMSEGSGNLISRVEKLKQLGAKAKKDIDAKLIERATEHDNPGEDA